MAALPIKERRVMAMRPLSFLPFVCAFLCFFAQRQQSTSKAGHDKSIRRQISVGRVGSITVTAAWVTNLKPGDRVLEPSAGTGSLAVHAMTAGVSEVIGKEISPQRHYDGEPAILADHRGERRATQQHP